MRQRPVLIPCLAAAAVLCGCGVDSGELADIIVSPHDGAAIHGSGTETVQFKAIGVYQTPGVSSTSFTQDLNNARWTTSDSANTTVDAQGLATCAGHTPVPAIITASRKGVNDDTISGGAFLTCD